MNRFLYLLLLLCAGCSTSTGYRQFNQAAAPAMVPMGPPPAYTPGFAPGTPAAPAYTPVGAGLPGERVPGTEAPAVPRSKGRMLPQTDEPGLWAADGDPVLSANSAGSPRILDVELPYPLAPGNPREGWMAKKCAREINDSLTKLGELLKARALTPAERQCFAASMYALCTQMTQRALTEAQGQPSPQELLQHVGQSHRLAVAFEEKHCLDGTLSSEGARIQQLLAVYWSRVHGGLR